MLSYKITPGAVVQTSGTPDAEVDHLRLLTVAARGAHISKFWAGGQGSGLTQIHGIRVRLKRYSTPSTVGSGITPRPTTPNAGAASLTAFTGPSVGSGATLQAAGFFGAAGPGGWQALNRGEVIDLDANGGANGNLDVLSSSGGTDLKFEYDMAFEE